MAGHGTGKVYALIDCNNFFASCERVFRPDLWHKPVAVLSNNDGCIIARSAEVKALGVPMGVPLFQVRSLLRQHQTAIFSANFALYGDMSQRITRIIEEVAPRIEVYSIDESFVDITDLTNTDYLAWAQGLSRRILHETGVPVAVGVAATKTLAKAAADHAKKHREDHSAFVALEPAIRQQMLGDMPVGDVWGIGRRYSDKLRNQGVSTALALTQLDDKRALRELTIRGLTTVRELRGDALLDFDAADGRRKTISRSRSFGRNIHDYHQLEMAVATFAATTGVKLRRQDSVCGAMVVYLRTPKHSERPARNVATVVRLAEPTADTGRLITAATSALAAIYDGDFSYQKAGVVLVDIVPRSAWQLSLIGGDNNRDRQVTLMRAVDAINAKFGGGMMWHASEDRSHAGWHSKNEQRSPAYTTSWGALPRLKS